GNAPATSVTQALNPGDVATITVYPSAIAASTTVGVVPPTAVDTLAITTNIIGDTTHDEAISNTPLGDVVTWQYTGGATLPVAPASVSLGSVPVNQTSGVANLFQVLESGNAGTPTDSLTVVSGNPTLFPV